MKLFVAIALLAISLPMGADEVVRTARWEFHNSFWMSLHQTLIDDAMRRTPRDLGTAWSEAVAAYRAAGGQGDITFAKAMTDTTEAIASVPDDAPEQAIDAPLAQALKRAARIYRQHGWPADERANRLFIAYGSALVREEGEGLIRQHEAVYHAAWPKRILAYITPSGGPFGAYTFTGRLGVPITTMASREEGYQGFRALEMLLHESSHAVVYPNRGTVGAAIEAAAKAHGVTAPRNLWHAVLFATSGELTRRLLAERGVTTFVPSSSEMFTKVWPNFRDPIEKFWMPYLNGQGTLEEAIDKMVVALAITHGARLASSSPRQYARNDGHTREKDDDRGAAQADLARAEDRRGSGERGRRRGAERND